MTQPSPSQLTRALAHCGVGRFMLTHLPNLDPMFVSMTQQFDLGKFFGGDSSWEEACASLAKLAPHLSGSIGLLLRDYQLQLHEWFLLALAGESETSHLLNLAIAALQQPQGDARPSLHLAAALCETLFDTELDPVKIFTHRLVHNGLLSVEGGGPLSLRALSIDPRLWAVLWGNPAPWPNTRILGEHLAQLIPESLAAQLPALSQLFIEGTAQVVVFRGPRDTARLATAQLARLLEMRGVEIAVEDWANQGALAAACRYAGWIPLLVPRLGPGENFSLPRYEAFPGPIAIALGLEGSIDSPSVVEIEIALPKPEQRKILWQLALGTAASQEVADSALLDGPAIVNIAERAKFEAERLGDTPGDTHIAHARRQRGSDRLRLLAQPVHQQVPEEALVLSAPLSAQLDNLVLRCRSRESLWEGLGTSLNQMNTGVRALFVGESGTGKTLAASRLATRLAAPLYRLDLSAVMNKYVGESEKNLGHLFDEAAAEDVILLLDEADALFGKRTEAGDSGERYANMLTNFLLTRIELYPGIAILTSNSRHRIDPAFTRRLDAILEFPLPGAEERFRIWVSHLGARSPGEENCRLLASYCDLAGGHIRNAVLNAAARSPRSSVEALAMPFLIAALCEEYAKQGRSIPPALDQLKG